jgi:hypothetical protein
MANDIGEAGEEQWEVYTMTHDDEMYDDDGEPIDDPDFPEWSVGFEVERGGHPYGARSACGVAENMTYSVACHIRDLHNATLT